MALFLVYGLISASERGLNAGLFSDCLVEADSPREVAEKLGAENVPEQKALYFPSYLFIRKGLGSYEYKRGNLRLVTHSLGQGIIRKITKVELFREPAKEPA